MIGWAINTALNAKIFDKIIVSTDDLIIKEISLSFGAEVPFLRPKNLSGDKTSTISVIKHAVQKLKKKIISSQNLFVVYIHVVLF